MEMEKPKEKKKKPKVKAPPVKEPEKKEVAQVLEEVGIAEEVTEGASAVETRSVIVDSCEELNGEETGTEVAEEASPLEEVIPQQVAPKEASFKEVHQQDIHNELLAQNIALASSLARDLTLEGMEPVVPKPKPKPVLLEIKPYTESQLAALYTNSELEMLDQFTADFVEAELKGLAIKQHPLYELLNNYLQVRARITGNSLELSQLRKEYVDLQGMLWRLDTVTTTGRGECQDGLIVTATHSCTKASFLRAEFQSICRILGRVQKLTYENHVLYSYKAEDWRLQIELYIQNAISNCLNVTRINKDAPVILSLQSEPLHLKPFLVEIRICISVLFAFQRKLLRDAKFIEETRQWLGRLVAVLLRLATYQDHLFILNHVLRCPAGIGSWAAPFIQAPLDDNLLESPFSSYQINHALSILSIILTPIRDRDRFLEDISQHDPSGEKLTWIIVDSDGEEDDEQGTSLRENDLVALLTQLPLESLFRSVLLVEKRNFENTYEHTKVTQHHILRFFAFSTVFLRILHKGLKTYSNSKYNQFSKRLSRFIRHIVQYATDQWEHFKKSNREFDDAAMMERLAVEYDSFFLRAIYYLYTSQKLGAWQFLAVVPYNLITKNTAWKIFYFLHDSDRAAHDLVNPLISEDFKSKLWNSEFRQQFEEKLASLADDESYYLLNTFANMALARDTCDMDFIEATTKDLLQVGFISKGTQEICSKSARTLLTHITSKHRNLLSLVLKEIKNNLESVGSLALYLYEELPLTVWNINDDDLELISWMLVQNIQSNESKLARMILSRLNWAMLPHDIHKEVALLVVRATEVEPGYTQWAWQTIMRLKLHINDKGFNDLHKVLGPEHYEELNRGIRQQQPLAVFVSLLMTTWGHLVPLICTNGLPQLLFLQTYQKHEAVLFCLYQIVPLFVNSQEYIINNEKFQEIMANIINADRGYISMAKSLISYQGVTVLQQFGNMIETQLVNYTNYYLDNPRFLVRMWINTLVSIPYWSRDNGIMYLLDVIIRAAFFHADAIDAVNVIFKELVQANSTQDQGGAITSLIKWVSNSNTNGSLITGSLASFPWLACVIIDIEFEEREKRTGLWRELLLQLNNQQGKISVDNAIKKAASILKLPTFTSGYLCIYRWAQQAMDTPIDHPILPLLWQKFFTLYLARVSLTATADKGCVGDKFFEGMVNFNFLKRMKRKLQETLEFHQEKYASFKETDQEDPARQCFLENCVSIFKAFSLWLEEPRLQKSNLLLPSLPPNYLPTLLAYIMQGSGTPWYEYIDHETIKMEQVKCVQLWNVSNFRHMNNINQPLSDPGRSMESPDPVERILRRLSIYEHPKPPPVIVNSAPLVPTLDFSSKEALFKSLEQCFKILKQFAHNQTLKVSEHKALDCSYQDLIPQLYMSCPLKVCKKVPCKGRKDTVNCSGAAVIVLEMQEARVSDRINHQIQINRNAYESLLTKSLQTPALALCTASVTLQQTIKILQSQKHCNPGCAELGTELFYHILSLINEETSSYMPTKNLFDLSLERLGQSHIAGVEIEMPRLLQKILEEPNLGQYLAPHFSPGNVGSANLLYMYSIICKEMGCNYNMTFALLSKFDIDMWLRTKEPKLNKRSDFIQSVVKALTILGDEPPIEALMLHCLYRKHLLSIFDYQFPEHYGEILMALLKASNGNTDSHCLLAKSVWWDILNALSRPVEINPKLPLKDQLRQYAQVQKILQHQELLETAELFSKHFTAERLQYGLYGLYPKCRKYVEVFVVLLGMTGHALIVSMLNTHQGLLGDKLCQKLWPYLTNLFAPWILPYSMQNEKMASWIQQLADDRQILLPWIPTDMVLAQKVIHVFIECIQFLMHALPACDTILSYIWQWYVTGFAHGTIKGHVVTPIHNELVALPWHNFWPTVSDLDFMVKVIDQYLPESHSFLGHIFMSVSWPVWLSNFKASPTQVKARVYHCFLNLLVKLCNEPNVRNKQSDKAKCLLVEAEQFDWSILDAPMYQNVMDWYVMSCDSNVIFKNDPLDLDFRVLNFLKTVAGYRKPPTEMITLLATTPDAVTKRLIFVKTYVKLVAVYANRHKKYLPAKEGELNSVINQQLSHLETVVEDQEEFKNLVKELLHLVNVECIGHVSMKCFGQWILNKPSDGIAIRALLQTIGVTVTNSEPVTALLELTLSSYFQNSAVNSSFRPSWKEVSDLLNIFSSSLVDLEQTMLNTGNVLGLNAIFIQRIERCNDTEALLNQALEWIATVKLNENTESKVPLLWFGILKVALIHCEKDEPTAGTILYKFARTLLQLSEDKGNVRWGRGLLSAIGISKPYTISISFRFLCRALAGYVLAQLPEMKGQPQVVRRVPNAPAKVGEPRGNAECPKVLLSLDCGMTQGRIKEYEELALKSIQDAGNSMHNAPKFLRLLTKQLYTKSYLKDIC